MPRGVPEHRFESINKAILCEISFSCVYLRTQTVPENVPATLVLHTNAFWVEEHRYRAGFSYHEI